ncbi:MAG: hypothetical protein K9M98_15370 [Cephaloticoccus sp.]|nr:hypothetical protein [Cephaloticoccus sp.]MCF7761880.1 hypothetical protein [Cephaloticoccus sp.]
MISPRQKTPRTTSRALAPANRGFAIAEVLLALLVLILAGGLLLTLLARSRQQQKCDAYIADLQNFSATFFKISRDHQQWPASTASGQNFPPKLLTALADTSWSEQSPFGGSYAWINTTPGDASGSDPVMPGARRGMIILTAFSPSFPLDITQSDLRYIDHKIDDGNLQTGKFHTGYNGWPVYEVEGFSP